MPPFTQLPLIAAGDLWEMIIGGIFFILWIVGQLLGSREVAKKKAPPRRPKPPQPQPDQRLPVDLAEGQRQPPRNQEEALRSEVEEFLRRTQGKPARKQPPKRKPVRRQPEQSDEPRTLVSKADRAAAPRQPTQPISSREGQQLRQEGVAEHVAKHLDTGAMTAHSAALGAELGQSDERLEARLHEKFDHSLGSIQKRSTAAAAKSPDADIAADIVALLSKPGGMRQMIVANEILKRPEW